MSAIRRTGFAPLHFAGPGYLEGRSVQRRRSGECGSNSRTARDRRASALGAGRNLAALVAAAKAKRKRTGGDAVRGGDVDGAGDGGNANNEAHREPTNFRNLLTPFRRGCAIR